MPGKSEADAHEKEYVSKAKAKSNMLIMKTKFSLQKMLRKSKALMLQEK